MCKNWNYIILNEIHKAIGNTLTDKKVLAVGANNGLELAFIFGKDFNRMNFDVKERNNGAFVWYLCHHLLHYFYKCIEEKK